MASVYFAPAPQIEFQEKLASELKKLIRPNSTVAIKLHMGEPGNKYFLKPEFTKKIMNIVKELGGKPFLFDSPVVYNSPRNNPKGYLAVAAKQGYTEKNIGCPIIVSDDFVSVKLKEVPFEFEVCKKLADADFVLVLSHVKGHYCSGFGAAIKNLGMGAVTKKTKEKIHAGGEPVFSGNCVLCGNCVKACPLDNIRLDKKQKRPFFDKTWCSGCSNCALVCEEEAIKPKINTFDFLLSACAKAARSKFRNYYFVNVILDVAQKCDCCSDAGPIIAKDVGVLFGKDIVAVDKASLDLVIKQEGKDPFLEYNKKSPLVHIKGAEKLGIGSTKYELICV